MAKEICKAILWVLLGAALTVGIISLVICIGSAVNGVSFAQQIVNWFGPKAKEIAESFIAAKPFLNQFSLVA